MRSLAYSYLRFSSSAQAGGDSSRRQHAMAEAYAAQYGLTLDARLNFRDMGTSAFRGRNAREGALRAFLDAVENGLVPIGSHLLVESLDRLSRDRILSAQALFLQIIQAGVTIVTLLDGRSYSAESLNANPTDLIISLVYMMRANEESATKSARIRAAWAEKRSHLDKKPFTSRCPGWLRLNKTTGKFEVLEERAAVVQRIYRESLAGVSQKTITVALNNEAIPLFGHGNQKERVWQRALIRYLLRTPLVIGTFTPHIADHVDGKTHFRCLDPFESYYPAIISRDDFDAAQAKRKAWSKDHRCEDRRPKTANVLARLSRCPDCDRPMVMLRTDKANERYLVCLRQREARMCSDRWVRYPGIEAAFTRDIRHVIKGCPRPALDKKERRFRLGEISRRLRTLKERQAVLEAQWARLRDNHRPARAAEDLTFSEVATLKAERDQLRKDRNYWQDATISLKLRALESATDVAQFDARQVNEALRSLLAKVVIDYRRSTAVAHWKHGGTSDVDIDIARQRGGTRNPSVRLKPACNLLSLVASVSDTGMSAGFEGANEKCL